MSKSLIPLFLVAVLLMGPTLGVLAQNCFSDNSSPGFRIPSIDLGNSSDYGLCRKGWHCPFLQPSNESGTWPRICPPSEACLNTRINNEFCEPQGPFEPTPCRGGNYCPTASLSIICPKGYFCPLGSTAPAKCSPFASCPAGTANEYNFVGIFFLVLVDAALVLVVVLYRRSYKAYVGEDQDRLRAADEKARSNPEVEEGGAVTQGASNRDLAPLFDLFQQAKGEASSLTFRFDNLCVKIPAAEVTGASTGPAPTSSGEASPTTSSPPPEQQPAEKQDKTLLRGVTGRFRPGTVTAIMGPSGAGKTVMLNTLLNKNSSSWKLEGTLNVNHQFQIADIRHVVGFVPQDDVLHPELTVEQNLYYSSETRLPASFTAADKKLLRDEIINVLSLDHARHTQIGDESSRGVSGGQRKRCSIGVELAACPTALFLDEPTTGLDAATALDLCTLLQRLSVGTQSTVVMVVHQPRVEIWNALDQVLLLAPGGRTVYQGAQAEAKAYFQTALGLSFEYGNPADIILDGIALQADAAVEMWETRMQELLSPGESHSAPTSPAPTQIPRRDGQKSAFGVGMVGDEEAILPPLRGASFPKQIYLAFHRQLTKLNTHILDNVLDVLLGTVCCIIMASAKIREEWVGLIDGPYALLAPKHKVYTLPMICMFYMLAVASAVAPSGIRTFGSGMPLYWREASSGHNKLAYFLGYSFVDLLRSLVGSLHFGVVAYIMAQPQQDFWVFWMWIALLFNCVDSQSAALSMWLRPDTAPLLSTIVAIFMGLLNGFANVPVVGPISYAWWISEGLMNGEVNPVRNIWAVDLLEGQASPAWNLSQPGLDLAMAIVIYFVYRLLGFILLVALNREKQR